MTSVMTKPEAKLACYLLPDQEASMTHVIYDDDDDNLYTRENTSLPLLNCAENDFVKLMNCNVCTIKQKVLAKCNLTNHEAKITAEANGKSLNVVKLDCPALKRFTMTVIPRPMIVNPRTLTVKPLTTTVNPLTTTVNPPTTTAASGLSAESIAAIIFGVIGGVIVLIVAALIIHKKSSHKGVSTKDPENGNEMSERAVDSNSHLPGEREES